MAKDILGHGSDGYEMPSGNKVPSQHSKPAKKPRRWNTNPLPIQNNRVSPSNLGFPTKSEKN